jgi:hypothetical protein
MNARPKRKRLEAAKEVAAKLNKLCIPICGSKAPDILEWKTVLTWRQELSAAAKRPDAKKNGKRRFSKDFLFLASAYELQKEQILAQVRAREIDPVAEVDRRLSAVAASLSGFEGKAQSYP